MCARKLALDESAIRGAFIDYKVSMARLDRQDVVQLLTLVDLAQISTLERLAPLIGSHGSNLAYGLYVGRRPEHVSMHLAHSVTTLTESGRTCHVQINGILHNGTLISVDWSPSVFNTVKGCRTTHPLIVLVCFLRILGGCRDDILDGRACSSVGVVRLRVNERFHYSVCGALI
jgi:hypothetical protein